MTARHFLRTACFIAVFVASAAAQSATKPDDPISGQWGTNGLTFLDLKFDGDRTLTGTVYWRHDSDVQQSEIKSGSFDTKTNAFAIEGEAPYPPNGPAAKYLIKGKVDKDTIAGTYKVGDNTGEFTFTKLPAGKL